MLKVWGRATSGNVQKVMWAIGELELPHDRIDLGGPFGGNTEQPYLALNPNGVVPTIEDYGFVLWESNACLRYIAAKYGAGRLEPSDASERASAGRWHDWQLTTAAPALHPLFWGLMRTAPEERDPAAIDAARIKTEGCMRILDSYLARTAYLAGDTFSMGDIPVAIIAYRYRRLSPDRPAMANFDRWYGAIEQRPAFQEHVLEIPFV